MTYLCKTGRVYIQLFLLFIEQGFVLEPQILFRKLNLYFGLGKIINFNFIGYIKISFLKNIINIKFIW